MDREKIEKIIYGYISPIIPLIKADILNKSIAQAIEEDSQYCECKEPNYYIDNVGVYHNYCVGCKKPLRGTINVQPKPKDVNTNGIFAEQGKHIQV